MENVILTQLWKWVSPGWFVLYGITLFVILFYRERFSRNARLFTIAMLLIFVILWNPLIANYLIPQYMNNAKEYSRIGWSLLSVPVTCYLLTQFAGDRPGRARFLMVFVIIFLLGGQVKTYYTLPTNDYKLPDEVLEVVDCIDANRVNDVNGNVQIGVLFPVDEGQADTDAAKVFFGIRHLDATMILTETTVDELQEAPNEGLEFLLADKDTTGVKDLGYHLVKQTASCDIYVRND